MAPTSSRATATPSVRAAGSTACRAGRSTHGVCTGVLSWLIEEGAADGTDLSGLPVALACRYSDDEPGSPWTWMLYLDARASGEQRAALEADLQRALRRRRRAPLPVGVEGKRARRRAPVEIEVDHTRRRQRLRIRDRVSVRIRDRYDGEETVTCVIPGHERRRGARRGRARRRGRSSSRSAIAACAATARPSSTRADEDGASSTTTATFGPSQKNVRSSVAYSTPSGSASSASRNSRRKRTSAATYLGVGSMTTPCHRADYVRRAVRVEFVPSLTRIAPPLNLAGARASSATPARSERPVRLLAARPPRS